MDTDFEKPNVADGDLRAHAEALARLKELRSELDDDLSVEMTMVFQTSLAKAARSKTMTRINGPFSCIGLSNLAAWLPVE
jgi:hypothetical protein